MVNISLRLWSDDVAVDPLLLGIGLRAKYLHRKGQPMPNVITRSGAEPRTKLNAKIAKRHYVSSQTFEVATRQEMLDVVGGILERIDHSPELVSACQTGVVKATLWVARIDSTSVVDLDFPTDYSVRARQLGVTLFLEDLAT